MQTHESTAQPPRDARLSESAARIPEDRQAGAKSPFTVKPSIRTESRLPGKKARVPLFGAGF